MNVLATDLAAQSLRTPARNELIRTGLLNAQHWLDHGCALLAQGLLGDWQTTVGIVERHLVEVVAALRAQPRSAVLVAQLDATTKATNEYWYGVLGHCSRRKLRVERALERSMDRIYEKIDQARGLLHLTHDLCEARHERADRPDDDYEAMALVPVLELIRLEAIRALLQLGGKDAPVREIVDEARAALERHVAHAEFLIGEHDGNDARFAPAVMAASDAVRALARVAKERVGADFSAVFDGLALLRTAVQLGETARLAG